MQYTIRFFLLLLISVGTLIPAYGIAAAPEGKDSGFIVVVSFTRGQQEPETHFSIGLSTQSTRLATARIGRSSGTVASSHKVRRSVCSRSYSVDGAASRVT